MTPTGTDILEEAPGEPPSVLPSKSEFIGRRTKAKRQLERLTQIQGFLPLGLMLLTVPPLLLALRYQIGSDSLQRALFTTVSTGGLIGIVAWPIWSRWRILNARGLRCPACHQSLAPASPLTWGRAVTVGSIAAAEGVCGSCRERVFQPSDPEPSSEVLPTRDEFLYRRRALLRQQALLMSIWFAGTLGCGAAIGLVSEWIQHGRPFSWPLLFCRFGVLPAIETCN